MSIQVADNVIFNDLIELEFTWHSWLFRTPERTIINKHTSKYFFQWFAEEHSISNPEDWYSYSEEDIKNVGGHRYLSIYNNSLYDALSHYFPGTSLVKHNCRPHVALLHFLPLLFHILAFFIVELISLHSLHAEML